MILSHNEVNYHVLQAATDLLWSIGVGSLGEVLCEWGASGQDHHG
jgi:hypothetical protein